MISRQSQGLLIDPESLKPFKDVKLWDPENDGLIKCEFFKQLGNLAKYDLKKLALHLLNRTQKRRLPYPKVSMKKIPTVLLDCYSYKEWLERNKRKHAIRKYLYQERRSLGFFDNDGAYRREKWKAFKKEFKITNATKNLLFTAPTEAFFSLAKRPSMKNKTTRELSPYAAEFFKVFLRSKGEYKKPEAHAFFKPYDCKEDFFAEWPSEVRDSSGVDIKLAVMDFRNIPGIINRETAPKESPYFDEFMDDLKQLADPSSTDPEVWLWI